MDATDYRLGDFSTDFRLLKTLKTYLNRRILELDSGNASDDCFMNEDTSLTDGQQVRLVFPHGPKALKDRGQKKTNIREKIYFVGFFGTKRSSIRSDVGRRIWKLDDTLIEEFKNFPDLLAYVSAQKHVKSDNWFNMVLCRTERVIDDWRDARNHDSAVG